MAAAKLLDTPHGISEAEEHRGKAGGVGSTYLHTSFMHFQQAFDSLVSSAGIRALSPVKI